MHYAPKETEVGGSSRIAGCVRQGAPPRRTTIGLKRIADFLTFAAERWFAIAGCDRQVAEWTTRMRTSFQLVFAMIIGTTTLAEPARAQGSAVYLATYVEVMANAVAPGVALLERYRDASRRENGNLRFDVLHELARPNRFAILEVWKDKTALDEHDKAASTLQWRDRLKEIESAPYDERANNGLYTGPIVSESAAGTIYVLTHVDVVPTHKDDAMALLKAMSIDTPKENGNVAYDVLQQANRGNHFTVVEAWTSRKAVDDHAMAPHTRAFRERLLPIAGALYDERFYKQLS